MIIELYIMQQILIKRKKREVKRNEISGDAVGFRLLTYEEDF